VAHVPITRLSLRQALETDQAFVAHLEEVCMRAYATALWGEWRPRPAEDFRADHHRIIVIDATDIGCIETVFQTDHLRLGKLYLLPAYQRRGWGAEILRRVIAEAASLNLPLRLNVLTTNPAQAFYRREGLSLIAQDKERLTFEADNRRAEKRSAFRHL